MAKVGWNITVAVLVFLFTYGSSIVNNTWQTALERSIIGFILFFFFVFPFQWIFSLLIKKSSNAQEENPIEKTGTTINKQTPNDDLLQQIGKGHISNKLGQESQNDFEPFEPPVIQKKKNAFPDMTPEDIANAVRALSND